MHRLQLATASTSPRARNHCTTRCTRRSGAEAPDVMPMRVAPPSSQVGSMAVSSSIRYAGAPCSRATSTSRHEFEELREPITSTRSTSRRERLHGRLAVRGGVADVVLRGRLDPREALAQAVDDEAGLVHRERRLRDVGQRRVGREVERVDLRGRLHQHDRLRRLAHRAHDLLVARVADEQDRVAALRRSGAPRCAPSSPAGRSRRRPARPRACAFSCTDGRDAVRREDDGRALRHVELGVDEDRAAALQLGHHVGVVHDLLAHVDRLRAGAARARARPSRRPDRRPRSSRAARPG